MNLSESNQKAKVHDFWNIESCGEVYAKGDSEKSQYEKQSQIRYQLEPYILPFANFKQGQNKDILEIGVGMGSDHIQWALSQPKSLTGIDLTERAIQHTNKRLKIYSLQSNTQVADAENLPFSNESFDLVYSWGVLHHSPNTGQTIQEVHRVLRHKGNAKVMIYHKHSLTGYMLWIRYAFFKFKWRTSLKEIYSQYLESPGTKAYTEKEAKNLFKDFAEIKTSIKFAPGDLLIGSAGQRHKGLLLSLAKAIWPRFIIKKLFKNHGLFLLIEAKK